MCSERDFFRRNLKHLEVKLHVRLEPNALVAWAPDDAQPTMRLETQ